VHPYGKASWCGLREGDIIVSVGDSCFPLEIMNALNDPNLHKINITFRSRGGCHHNNKNGK
jgi:hypothetical protein